MREDIKGYYVIEDVDKGGIVYDISTANFMDFVNVVGHCKKRSREKEGDEKNKDITIG